MIANALIVTIAILLAMGFWLLGDLRFLVPYKVFFFHHYLNPILAYFAVLSVNLFALLLAINRRFFLKDTGRKLSHIDRQLHAGHGEAPAPSLDAIDEEQY